MKKQFGYLYRDINTKVLFNTDQEKSMIPEKLKKIFDSVKILYLYYSHNKDRYNMTVRKVMNEDRVTGKKFLDFLDKNFIRILNKEYDRQYKLTGKKLEAIQIIGYILP